MSDQVERMRKGGTKIDDAWLRRIGPAHFGHIDFRGISSPNRARRRAATVSTDRRL